MDVTASKARKKKKQRAHTHTQSLKEAGFSLANSIKPALEVDYGFINSVCSFWERTKAKTIWQTDEGRSLKNLKESLGVYLFMTAPSSLAGAARDDVIKRDFMQPSDFWQAKRDRDHMKSAVEASISEFW